MPYRIETLDWSGSTTIEVDDLSELSVLDWDGERPLDADEIEKLHQRLVDEGCYDPPSDPFATFFAMHNRTVPSAEEPLCFAAGTLVLMADGSTRAIETIEVGQMVWASPETDPEADPTPCRVMEVHHNPPARLLSIAVGLSNSVIGEQGVIRATERHPIFAPQRGWVEVHDLIVGDVLRSFGETKVKVRKLQAVAKPAPVYNLRVEGNHTYYVAIPGSSTGILVHNDSTTQPSTTEPSATQPSGNSAPIIGQHVADSGTFEWTLRPLTDKDQQGTNAGVSFDLSFEPKVVDASTNNITFIQVLTRDTANRAPSFPNPDGDTPPTYWQPFLSAEGSFVDHTPGDQSPYYGTVPSGNGVGLVKQSGHFGNPGGGPDDQSRPATANMSDAPSGSSNAEKEYETFAVNVATGYVYGGLKWGYVATSATPDVELVNGQAVNMTPPPQITLTAVFEDKPSQAWTDAVAQWNSQNGKTSFTPKLP
jgi:pretoxin HINT domain-containing protein